MINNLLLSDSYIFGASGHLGTGCAFYASVVTHESSRFGVESLRMREAKSMDKRESQPTRQPGQGAGQKGDVSPWARYWERQKRMPQDSHLISFGERVTYTFALGHDVASIHYDQGRSKLFYKGHRITPDNLEPWLIKLLQHFKTVLADSEYSDRFLGGYQQLLNKMLEKKASSQAPAPK